MKTTNITLIKTSANDFWATIEIAITSDVKVIDGGSKTTVYAITETCTVNKGEKVLCQTADRRTMPKGYTGEMTTGEAMRVAADRCVSMGYAAV